MASRRETQEQQQEVESALRALLGGGALRAGAMLPSVSDLAQQHGVSRYIAHRALQSVGQEGLFHAVPKVGSFAGKSKAELPSHGVLVDEANPHPYLAEIQTGFDLRVAALGGAALEMAADGQGWREAAVDGAFLLVREERLDWAASVGLLELEVAGVRIGSHWRAGERLDLVSFDNEDGGFRATRHLIERGCNSIAYLGVHVVESATSAKEWSLERESGWRRALREAGLPWHGLAFGPQRETDDAEGARNIGRELSAPLRERGDVRGVVAANDAVAIGLLSAFREAGVPREQWPAVVAFDNSEAARRLGITSLRLPWNELGAAAADVLHSRARGELPANPQHRGVPMRLIPRLSCRQRWPTAAVA